MSDMTSMPSPKNSETFLAPSSCSHAKHDDATTREQAADRERVVCAIGLDVHYELNVVANEPGSYQPRLKPFNPRMSGPACPYNYTGRFIRESEHQALLKDPVEHGRKIAAKAPYHPTLYKVRDPRLVSKTVVIRDYGCKIPIDLADTEKVARAVLNHYPDQYVAFLGEFVSNLFGGAMRTYLETQRAGYRRLIENDRDLNRVSWAVYRSVQGGCSLEAAPDGRRDDIIQKETGNNRVLTHELAEYLNNKITDADCDHSLAWFRSFDAMADKLTEKGRAMTGECPSDDVFDLRPCLRQHIETLTEMIDVWCRGFGTKETHALAMMWWCNDQGRNLCDDLKLITDAHEVDYERIGLQVPVDLFARTEDSVHTRDIKEPDEDTFVRKSLHLPPRDRLACTPSFNASVGRWSGAGDVIATFMGAMPQSDTHWGWGHPANLFAMFGNGKKEDESGKLLVPVQQETSQTAKQYSRFYAPYMAYDRNGTRRQPKADKKFDLTYVSEKWSSLKQARSDVLFADQEIPTRRSVLASLLEDERPAHPYRGANDETYRAVTAFPLNPEGINVNDRTLATMERIVSPDDAPPPVDPLPFVSQCPIPLIDENLYSGCRGSFVDPLLTHQTCFEIKDGHLRLPVKSIGPYYLTEMAKDPTCPTNFDGKELTTAIRNLKPYNKSGMVPYRMILPVRSIIEETSDYSAAMTIGAHVCDEIGCLQQNRPENPVWLLESGKLVKYKPKGCVIEVSKDNVPESRIKVDKKVYELGIGKALTGTIFNPEKPETTIFGLFAPKLPERPSFNPTDVDRSSGWFESLTDFEQLSVLDMGDFDWSTMMKNGKTVSVKDIAQLPVDVNATPMATVSRLKLQILFIRTSLSFTIGPFAAATICSDAIEESIANTFLASHSLQELTEEIEQAIRDVYLNVEPSSNTGTVVRKGTFARAKTAMRRISPFRTPSTVVAGILSERDELSKLRDTNPTTVIKELNKLMDTIKDEHPKPAAENKIKEDPHFKWMLDALQRVSSNEGKRTENEKLINDLARLIAVLTSAPPQDPSTLLLYCLLLERLKAGVHHELGAERDDFNFRIFEAENKPKTEILNAAIASMMAIRINFRIDPHEILHRALKLMVHRVQRVHELIAEFPGLADMKKILDSRDRANPFLSKFQSIINGSGLVKKRQMDEIRQFGPGEKGTCLGCLEQRLNNNVPGVHRALESIPLRPYDFDDLKDTETTYFNAAGKLPQDNTEQHRTYLNSLCADVASHLKKLKGDALVYGPSEFNFIRPKHLNHLHPVYYFSGDIRHYSALPQDLKRKTDAFGFDIMRSALEDLSKRPAIVPFLQELGDLLSDGTRARSYPYRAAAYDYPSSDSKKDELKLSSRLVTDDKLHDDVLEQLKKFKFNNSGRINYEDVCAFFPIDGGAGEGKEIEAQAASYNFNPCKAQLFSMLDASSLLWTSREFVNPADCERPQDANHTIDGMHYWSRTLVESFAYSRAIRDSQLRHRGDDRSMAELWEFKVKMEPSKVFPTKMIGSMTDESFSRYFPLIPKRHRLREDLRKMRAMDIMWGTLPTYRPHLRGTSKPGAWMPISVMHQMRLLKTVGLFDETYLTPRNPWLAHNGTGVSRVFNQSYHSVFHTDSYQAPHFQDWMEKACKYQRPSVEEGPECFYPFSRYGGTPVEADFIHHKIEKPERPSEARHKQIVYNRFGMTQPMRLGQQFHDTGLLQDLFSYEYRPYADLSPEQRAMDPADAVWPSSFLAYARNHAIIAIASCNAGTEEPSVPRIVRNTYRLFVDTYECMGSKIDEDGVPVVMGFLPTVVQRKEDRPVVLFAGSLSCLNTKLEKFCASSGNAGEKVCQSYKQVYLNDATLLFSRLVRQRYRRELHRHNHQMAQIKRQGKYPVERFNEDLIELQDAYIEFLQTSLLGLLIETGADLNNVPLQLLEPRELEVSLLEEDDNMVGNDYLTPRTKEIIKMMDFGDQKLNRTQLAILSLIPPNHRILGTYTLNQKTEVVDMKHLKEQIMKDTVESNKKVWQKYMDHLISGAFAQKMLEVTGQGIDFSFDFSAIKDPLKMAEGLPKRVTAMSAKEASSSVSQNVRAESMRKDTGPDSVLTMNRNEMDRALEAVRSRVERDYQKHGGSVPRVRCLAMLRVPEHMKRMLKKEYEY